MFELFVCSARYQPLWLFPSVQVIIPRSFLREDFVLSIIVRVSFAYSGFVLSPEPFSRLSNPSRQSIIRVQWKSRRILRREGWWWSFLCRRGKRVSVNTPWSGVSPTSTVARENIANNFRYILLHRTCCTKNFEILLVTRLSWLLY